MAEAKKAAKKPATKTVKAKKEQIDGDYKESAQITNEGTDQGVQEAVASEETATAEDAKVAKAGKRSAKAIKEAGELQAKEERKQSKAEATASEEKKPAKNPTRSKLERSGKKFRKVSELIEKEKDYSLKEALTLATQTSTTKFDATVELHVRLNVDPRQADQNIRDNLVLPEGTGKTVRVAVLAEGDDAAAAKKAGADIASSDELLKSIDKGEINFDILIATPMLMARLGKHARVLGPKGLMPNPKSGTVTTDVASAVAQSKAGRVEYRVDSTGIVHLGVGKVSFGADKLETNTRAVLTSIKSSKPSSIKGSFVRAIHVSTSMGPGIRVLTSEL